MSDSDFLKYGGSGLLVIGFLISLFGAYSVWYAHSAAWVETSGSVIGVRVRTGVHSAGDALRRDNTYTPEIEYQYSVDDKSYQSDRYQLRSSHPWFVDRKKALRVALKYRVGDSIAVFYNTKQPSVSVLKPSVQWADYAALLIGLLFLFTGWLLRRASAYQAPS